MFGAVLTHVHNGDPLNDSTGAIAILVRLAALAVLLALAKSRQSHPTPYRKALLKSVAAGCSWPHWALAQFGISQQQFRKAQWLRRTDSDAVTRLT